MLFMSQIYVSGKPVCDLHENDGASVTQFKYNYHIILKKILGWKSTAQIKDGTKVTFKNYIFLEKHMLLSFLYSCKRQEMLQFC